MAHFLQTRSEPSIVSEGLQLYDGEADRLKLYLPWKLTERQEDQIDDQIRDAKERNLREFEAFEARKEKRSREYGPAKRLIKSKEPPAATEGDVLPGDAHRQEAYDEAPPIKKEENLEPPRYNDKDHHDEPAGVLEEAEEDMVIY